jgi:hypothetical protein
MISDELTLMLVMAGLYLYDSVLMLAINEAPLIQAGRQRWSVAFGIGHYRLAGREPFLPNPFTPHRRLYRMAWAVDTVGEPDAVFLASLDNGVRFRGLGWCVCIMAVALFVLLPIGLFSRLGHGFALLAIALFYLSALLALVRLSLGRRAFGISAGAVASIAVQSLICPPFAINLVRKLCEAQKPAGDLLATAALLLPPDKMEIVKARCRERLDEQIDFEAEGSARSLAMIRARQRLAPREPCEPCQESEP